MNKEIKHLVNSVLSCLLVLLGFGSCSSSFTDDNGGNVLFEYGTPTVIYRVKGTVTSEEGTPLQGIRVIVKDKMATFEKNQYVDADTLYTDSEGIFTSHKATATASGPETLKTKVIFKEMGNGGTFKEDSLEINGMKKKVVTQGDGSWFHGDYELTADKKLKKN
jgi:putative lipoprotein (rSAM/lipoprotein system)